MNKPKKCDTLLETLSVYFVGRVNQVKSADLARLFELEPKQIQELVHTLRREGHENCDLLQARSRGGEQIGRVKSR